ncbi:MAG: O-antigen ligase family protein, partial [Candidatus Thorarchaeota archaeon]
EDALSAGRLKVWPYMLDKVGDSPLIGFGRLGYQRSGIYAYITEEVDPTFPHPHCAYIEWLLDNGWLGMAVMMVLYGLDKMPTQKEVDKIAETWHPLETVGSFLAWRAHDE